MDPKTLQYFDGNFTNFNFDLKFIYESHEGRSARILSEVSGYPPAFYAYFDLLVKIVYSAGFLKLISQDHVHDSNKLKMHDTQSNVLNSNLTYIISINVKDLLRL